MKRAQLTQMLCYDLTDSCSRKPPKLPKVQNTALKQKEACIHNRRVIGVGGGGGAVFHALMSQA